MIYLEMKRKKEKKNVYNSEILSLLEKGKKGGFRVHEIVVLSHTEKRSHIWKASSLICHFPTPLLLMTIKPKRCEISSHISRKAKPNQSVILNWMINKRNCQFNNIKWEREKKKRWLFFKWVWAKRGLKALHGFWSKWVSLHLVMSFIVWLWMALEFDIFFGLAFKVLT